MKRSKSILIGLIVTSLVVGGGGYYWYTQQQPQEYIGPVDKITLAAVEYLTGALVYVAEEHFFFEANGLDVTIKGYASGKAAADALMAGEADISTSADFVFVSNSFDNTDLTVIGTVATKQIKELVARKDKGISEIEDLIGKRIAVKEKSGAEFQLGSFLTFNGISRENVEIVYLKPSEMLDAITNEAVDAVFVWDPYLYNVKKALGANAVSWAGGEDFYFVLLTNENWLSAHRAAVGRFMKAIVEADDYVKSNDEAVREFTKRKFDYDSDYMDYSWPNQRYDVILSQAMLMLFEDQARWRIRNNLTEATEVPNYLDYIYSDALREVKPGAVTIVGQGGLN